MELFNKMLGEDEEGVGRGPAVDEKVDGIPILPPVWSREAGSPTKWNPRKLTKLSNAQSKD
jgi:hypothetical protein